MGKTTRVTSKYLTWVDIIHPKRKDLEFLKTKFKISEKHIQQSLPSAHAQRPNVLIGSNYIFIVALLPIYNHETFSIESAEVDVFITDDHLITIHDQKIQMMDRFYQSTQTSDPEQHINLDQRPSYLFYEMLDYLYHDLFPKLDNVSRDIKTIEENIFKGDRKDLIQDILIVKSNILNFKRIMQAHRSMIRKILRIETKHFGSNQDSQLYYTELLEHVKDIWSILETYGESIESLENTSNAIIDQRMNTIITTLTLLTMLLFPFSLLSGLFGVNAKNMPIIGHPLDFWILVGIMAAISTVFIIIFKKKRWI
jgi:magnesium transporter